MMKNDSIITSLHCNLLHGTLIQNHTAFCDFLIPHRIFHINRLTQKQSHKIIQVFISQPQYSFIAIVQSSIPLEKYHLMCIRIMLQKMNDFTAFLIECVHAMQKTQFLSIRTILHITNIRNKLIDAFQHIHLRNTNFKINRQISR